MIDAGKISYTPKGVYDPNTSYEYLDCVSYMGDTYAALKATKGNLPTDNTYWCVFVKPYISEQTQANADAAALSEANAKASETAAKTSENNAKTSETNATAAETAAVTAQAEITKLVQAPDFAIDLTTGELLYNSNNYDFTVNQDDGNLYWGAKV